MTLRLWLFVVAAWIVSLVGVAAWAGAQNQWREAVPKGGVPAAPVVYAGQDLGFRVDSEIDGVKRGTLVIRVDGEWVEAQFAARVTPVK